MLDSIAICITPVVHKTYPFLALPFHSHISMY